MSDLERPARRRGSAAERDARRAPRLALATDPSFPDLDADSAPLLQALRDRGVDARPAIWSDPEQDWASYDAVAIRSTWDYYTRFDDFLTWIRGVPVPVVNPPDVVAWNGHKSYLRDLEERGVPVVDTAWGPQTVPWPEAIVKPALAGSAHGLRRVREGDSVDGDVLVQPFLASIETEGELSLLYAAGALSHAVRKTPRQGDIRVQSEHGGTAIPIDPDDEATSVAEAALRAVGTPVAYARADLVRANDGTLRLIELELIEPSLFLLAVPEAAGRFADAILSAALAPSP